MNNVWAFLLQTLTVSGVALLLLAVKAIFRDKLSPRWQFAAWSVLGIMLLLPAGWKGRYVLLEWPFYVEVLRSRLTGEYGVLTRVGAPAPLPPSAIPETVWDWLFVLYLAGVLFFLARYGISYLRLRLALRRGRPAGEEQVRRVAERYGLPVCSSLEVEGLSTAFVCGVLRPVLVLPAGKETDDKVILHELLHFRYRDVLWGMVIGFFRCVHWCNPLLWYCADLAGNDLESLCDQRVLEHLEGEDRRDYGRILLSMVEETYARAPGTSSMANGGKNIARRIEAIARFKRYPAGMALVSVCVLVVLTATLAIGTAPEGMAYQGKGNTLSELVRARTVPCATYGGALDVYAKALLLQRFDFRAMCAPLEEQDGLAEGAKDSAAWSPWELDLEVSIYEYDIYNLAQVGEDTYEGLLALKLNEVPGGESWDSTLHSQWLAVQTVRAKKEGTRWVVVPLEEFRYVQGDQRTYGNEGLPWVTYEARWREFIVQARWQTTSSVESGGSADQITIPFSGYRTIVRAPQPNADLSTLAMQDVRVFYVGPSEEKGKYEHIGVSIEPLRENEERPGLAAHIWTSNYSISSEGWGGRSLEEGWSNEIHLGGFGSDHNRGTVEPPAAFAVDLYLNLEKVAELTLLPTEGAIVNDR